ncbi:hypothetical protein [Photobacterium leiognathi]|uniref:hypothetical protein n=1 Tax=Photobacterium leiognathi TaxID=553611 RepID=UPI0011B1CAD9|nr:hypothetical protein [Photobacterium leiognathi]
MAEVLGVVDPRSLYEEMDSELVALWLAYFSIKKQAITGDKSPPQHTFINEPDLDQQVSACERLLL